MLGDLVDDASFNDLVLNKHYTVRRLREELGGLEEFTDADLIKQMLHLLRQERDNDERILATT
jgi:hypothetical protein